MQVKAWGSVLSHDNYPWLSKPKDPIFLLSLDTGFDEAFLQSLMLSCSWPDT